MEPVTRKEQYLDAIVDGGTDYPSPPVTRYEIYMTKIAGGDVEIPAPVTRIEAYLAAIAGMDVEIPDPITRVEMYLAKIAGMDIDPPEPVTRLEMWLSEWAEKGGGGEIVTVTGVSPLTLANALAAHIRSLTQYGKCTQASTPTPSAPVDIKCNNGALKVRKQSGIPLAYKKVEYIEGTADGQYIDTGFNILSNDVTYSAHYRLMPTGCTNYGGTSSTQWGYMGMNAAFMLAWTGNNGIGVSSAGAPYVEGHIYEVTHNRGIGGTRTLRVDDIDIELSKTETVYTNRPFGIFRLSPFATTYNRIWGRIYEFQGYVDGVLTHDLVPVVRLSDNEAGLYNKVNGDFLTNAGTGTFLVGNDVSDPIEIYADGTPEVLTVTDEDSNTQTASAVDLFAVGDYADTQDIISGAVERKVGIKVFDGTETWSYDSANQRFSTVIIGAMLAQTVRTEPLICSHYECLWHREPISLVVAGDCYIGTSSYFFHDTATTAADFKAFLAAQYAAGTPVIVLYPLATETTEHATPQPLRTTEGTNTVSVSAEVSGIELKAVYMAEENA